MDANNIGLKARVKDIGIIKVKMLLIKHFNRLRNRLKRVPNIDANKDPI